MYKRLKPTPKAGLDCTIEHVAIAKDTSIVAKWLPMERSFGRHFGSADTRGGHAPHLLLDSVTDS